MTKAVVATAYGGPEVLSVIDVDTPAPGPGQVLVAVQAASVNPFDLKVYSGMMGSDPGKLPMRLGLEASGVVTDAGSVLPKPAELDWATAAGLLMTGATAAHLVAATGVSSGDTVLVHGAYGGVGLSAAQQAVARGARVIGTAAESNHEALRAYGVEPVAYGDGLADRVRELAPEGVDVALDTVGVDEAVDVSLELVADRSRIASVAAFSRAEKEGFQLLGGGGGGAELRKAARPGLIRMAADGELDVVVGASYPLAEVAAAHELVRSGHAGGKVILLP